MDRDEAKKRWNALLNEHSDKAYVSAKFRAEIDERLEVAVLRIVQGLACARRNKLLSAADIRHAQNALLDIAQAREDLGGLAAMLEIDMVGLKDRMEALEGILG